MSADPNPFLDPDDGHVLADDGEKERQTGWAVNPSKPPKRKKAKASARS